VGLNWVRTDIEFKDDASSGGELEGVPTEFNKDAFSGIFGAGIFYRLTQNMKLGLSYEQMEVDEVDLNTVSFDFGFIY
jgi:opacity protein-like surface antigen